MGEAAIPGHRHLDEGSRNRSLRDISRQFFDQLSEDASFDDVMETIGTGTFSLAKERNLHALDGDDLLGFAPSASRQNKRGTYFRIPVDPKAELDATDENPDLLMDIHGTSE